jgi:hypothetical protein
VLLALALALLGPAPARAQVAVAWTDGATGSAGAMRTRAPFSARARVVQGGADAVLGRAYRSQLFSLSRSAGTVVLFTTRWRVRRTFELGADAQLEDMAVAAPCTAYLTRRTATHLLRLDLCTGATAEVIDLAAFADADGIPDLGAMVIDRGHLFVQIRRMNEEGPHGLAPPGYLAVIDLATEQLVDVDPATPGAQAITLLGTAAKHRMQIVAATRRLFVSATGAPFDAGGIEVIDLDTLRSEGLVIREADGLTGADLGPFVMITPDRGYLVFSTDFDLSSHLHRFSLSGGVEPEELHVSVGYAVPALVHDPLADTLLLPDGVFGRQGVHVFAASTGERPTTAPIPTNGQPTDLLLLRAPSR